MQMAVRPAWTLLAGDVFQAPKTIPGLALYVGTGAQILCASATVLLLTAAGPLSPARRGAFLSIAPAVYLALSAVGGFAAVALLRSAQRGAASTARCVTLCLQTASYFPGATRRRCETSGSCSVSITASAPAESTRKRGSVVPSLPPCCRREGSSATGAAHERRRGRRPTRIELACFTSNADSFISTACAASPHAFRRAYVEGRTSAGEPWLLPLLLFKRSHPKSSGQPESVQPALSFKPARLLHPPAFVSTSHSVRLAILRSRLTFTIACAAFALAGYAVISKLVSATGSSVASPAALIFLVGLWLTVGMPTAVLGGALALRTPLPAWPTGAAKASEEAPPRQRLRLSHRLCAAASYAVCAIVPALTSYLQLFHVMSSVWSGMFFWMHGRLLAASAITALCVAALSISHTCAPSVLHECPWQGKTRNSKSAGASARGRSPPHAPTPSVGSRLSSSA